MDELKPQTKHVNWKYFCVGFFLPLVAFVLELWLKVPEKYQALVAPYYTWLKSTGYYEHVYRLNCHRRCVENIPHDLPLILVFLMVGAALYFAIFYRRGGLEQKSFCNGLLSSGFFLILLFILVPLGMIVFSSFFK